MPRTFRRKNFSPVQESRFIGYEVKLATDIHGNCSMTPKEQEQSLAKEFHRFHSDKWRFNSAGPIIRAAVRRLRKQDNRKLRQALKNGTEEVFQHHTVSKAISGWLW